VVGLVKGIRGFIGKIDSAPSSQVADEYPIQTAAIQECTVSDVLHGAGDGHSFEIATLKECKTAYGGHWSYDNVRDLAAENIVQRHSALPVVRFKPTPLPGGARKPTLVRLFTRPDDKSVAGADPRVRNLVSHRQPLKPDADGYYTLVLSGGSHFYVYGDVSDVLAKYPRSSDAVWDQGLTAEKS